MIHRRSFLAALGALPLLRWVKPKVTTGVLTKVTTGVLKAVNPPPSRFITGRELMYALSPESNPIRFDPYDPDTHVHDADGELIGLRDNADPETVWSVDGPFNL